MWYIVRCVLVSKIEMSAYRFLCLFIIVMFKMKRNVSWRRGGGGEEEGLCEGDRGERNKDKRVDIALDKKEEQGCAKEDTCSILPPTNTSVNMC